MKIFHARYAAMPELIVKDVPRLLDEIRQCRTCETLIPEPNPVLRANSQSKILIIGQAPGTKVHLSGVPWNDASGKRLRDWMGISDAQFYDEALVAIVPMGFCYPGKGKSGDLPPRPECAPQWHDLLLNFLPNIECTLLIGQYAQNYYLPGTYKTLTDRVKHWRDCAPDTYVLPHPSPRNQIWLKKNIWFEQDVLPQLRETIKSVLV